MQESGHPQSSSHPSSYLPRRRSLRNQHRYQEAAHQPSFARTASVRNVHANRNDGGNSGGHSEHTEPQPPLVTKARHNSAEVQDSQQAHLLSNPPIPAHLKSADTATYSSGSGGSSTLPNTPQASPLLRPARPYRPRKATSRELRRPPLLKPLENSKLWGAPVFEFLGVCALLDKRSWRYVVDEPIAPAQKQAYRRRQTMLGATENAIGYLQRPLRTDEESRIGAGFESQSSLDPSTHLRNDFAMHLSLSNDTSSVTILAGEPLNLPAASPSSTTTRLENLTKALQLHPNADPCRDSSVPSSTDWENARNMIKATMSDRSRTEVWDQTLPKPKVLKCIDTFRGKQASSGRNAHKKQKDPISQLKEPSPAQPAGPKEDI